MGKWLGRLVMAALAALPLGGCVPGCDGVTLYPAGATGWMLATDCPRKFELDGNVYYPTNIRVRDELIGPVVASDRSSQEYSKEVARSIRGVPVEDAIALRIWLGGREVTWELGFNAHLTDQEEDRIQAVAGEPDEPSPGPTPTS